MLFDLRSRGRRRAVKSIYVFLAVLMGSGLVLFGIGGAVSGGLLNAFNGSSNSGGTSSGTGFEKRIQGYERRVRRNRRDYGAWAQLAELRYQDVVADGKNYDNSTGAFTAAGKDALAGVASAWNGYLAAKPRRVDADLVTLMEGVFSPSALNQPAEAVTAIEAQLSQTKNPSLRQLEIYAAYASVAGQTRKATLTQTQAEQLAARGKTGKAKRTAQTTASQTIAALEYQLSPSSSTTTTPSTLP